MKINEILRNYLNEHTMSMREFSRRCGLSNTYITNIVNGTDNNPSLDVLTKIALAMGISSQDLFDMLDGEQNLSLSKRESLSKVKIIYDDYFPLHYHTNLSAGTFDELLDSEPNAVVYVPIVFQSKKNRLHAFKVNGTSMNNIIPDGSIVVAEMTDKSNITDGTIVVAFVNGCATVKRIYTNGNNITLMPDSTDKNHQPMMFGDDNQVFVIGRVLWHMNPENIADYY